MPRAPVLAIDLGGTKLAAALIDGPLILERRETPTDRTGGPTAWIEAVARLVAGWTGTRSAGIAVTGLVRDGVWRAVNPDTLAVPDDFPLTKTLAAQLGMPVVARNDAQAAAWGEYRFGAGRGGTAVFVTVSTGIGGGIVIDGRLVEGRRGLAGHIGISPIETTDGVRMLEEVASGAALARMATGHGGAAAVTTAALQGE
ncbi:ROK family protein, partial [Lichenifustis flavocetrariae]